ncbi:Hypothetical predicted protein, partial [Pelobates cultripes]
VVFTFFNTTPLPTQCPSPAADREGIPAVQVTNKAPIRLDIPYQPPIPEAEDPIDQQGALVSEMKVTTNHSQAMGYPTALHSPPPTYLVAKAELKWHGRSLGTFMIPAILGTAWILAVHVQPQQLCRLRIG